MQQGTSSPGFVGAYLAAAERGRLLEVKRWVARGVDINSYDDSGFSALALAAANNHAAITRFLLATGEAEVHKEDEGGHTALWWVAWCGNEAGRGCVSLDHRADIHGEDKQGWTPLRAAMRKGRGGAVALLLKRGATIDRACSPGPLASATRRRHVGVVRALLQHWKPVVEEHEVDQEKDLGEALMIARASKNLA